MRWVYFAIALMCVAAIVIFVRSRALVTMSFLAFGVCGPLSTLAIVVGGSLYALLRKSITESQLSGAR